MSNRLFKIIFGLTAIAFVVSSQGCAGGVSTPAGIQPMPSPQIQATSTDALPISASPTVQAEVASPTALPVPTASPITISAVDGNVFILRGPDLAYNAISALMKGQKVTALGRDVLARWALIPIPDQPKKTGWISIQTKFTAVGGDAMTLPVVAPADRPKPTYFRNCTNHKMIVEPGDIVLLSVSGYPDNIQWINPGVYTIHDYDLPKQPEVFSAELREGLSVDITQDASGERRLCPETMIKP